MRPRGDGGSELGIARPDGDPGALEAAAADLRGAAGTFSRFAAGLQSGSQVADWQGLASFTFADRCVSEASAVASGAGACANAAKVVDALAHKLRAAQRACDRALQAAQDADRRQTHASTDEAQAR